MLFMGLPLLWRLLCQLAHEGIASGRRLAISTDLAGRINEPLGLSFVVGFGFRLFLAHFQTLSCTLAKSTIL
jgi:hypothetical protein